jgi:uridine kinase
MNPHIKASKIIYSLLVDKILKKESVYIISLAGESGSGKTETGNALVKEFAENGISALLLEQDHYFFLPPKANDTMRKKDPEWLGPHKEVNLELLNKNLNDAINGADSIVIPHIDYDSNKETSKIIGISGVRVIIVEGTYTSLLKSVDTKMFIDEDYKETLKYRKLRNRGNEVNDPFVEGVLETEHKIIAGHKYLADIVITKNYEVILVEESLQELNYNDSKE